MKGMIYTKRLNSEQQVNLLEQLLREDIVQLRTLPKDEAKKVARKNLYKAGIVDKNGKYTEPYIALKQSHV